MRFFLAFLGLLVMFPWSTLQAREVYTSGPYTVRQEEKGTCMLDIALHKRQEPVAILVLFPSDEYYGEIVTERARIGSAKKKVRVQFDKGKPVDIRFLANAADKDEHFRWQYLVNTRGLLRKVSKHGKMTVSFSNGSSRFKYTVSLKGSARAVRALRRCR